MAEIKLKDMSDEQIADLEAQIAYEACLARLTKEKNKDE